MIFFTFNWINGLKDKISHVSVNLGRNKGLHVNANTAIGMTRGKHCLVINDDMKITRPFMRQTTHILNHAPYINSIYLEGEYDPNSEPANLDAAGLIECQLPDGTQFGTTLRCGAAAPVFRKDYWYEVGGYAEDDVFGDLPFNNRGWKRGYFTGLLTSPRPAFDTDKGSPEGGSQDSSGQYIDDNCYTNYPKLFRVDEGTQRGWSRERSNQCSQNNAWGRQDRTTGERIQFNDFGLEGWYDYIQQVTSGGNIDWGLLESKFHGRFLEHLKQHAHPRYTQPS